MYSTIFEWSQITVWFCYISINVNLYFFVFLISRDTSFCMNLSHYVSFIGFVEEFNHVAQVFFVQTHFLNMTYLFNTIFFDDLHGCTYTLDGCYL